MRFIKGGVLVFDSGVGGLTVLWECLKRMPNEIFLLLRRQSSCALRQLTARKIVELVFRAIEKCAFLNARAVVLACNTATAVAVERLREKYSIPVIGVEPAIFLGARALEKQGGGVLQVLATRATCASERVRILKERAESCFPKVEINLLPCLELAGAIEKGLFNKDFCVERYLPTCLADGVVLGCTHYVYFKNEIACFYSSPTFDGGEGVARRLQEILEPQIVETGDNIEIKQRRNSQVKIGEISCFDDVKMDFLRDAQPLKTTASFLGETGSIFFFGASKSYNQRVFEQMFVNVRK